jgi:antitoxin VapB
MYIEVAMQTLISRIFVNGNSQAVRIPQDFRLDANRVEITRTESGDLIIHPLPLDRGQALLDVLASFNPEFAVLLEQDREEQLPVQERGEI